MEDVEQTQQDVNTQESSAPATSESQEPSQATQPESTEQPRYVPYDRFQELVQARNERDQQLKTYEERMSKMESDFKEQLAKLQPQQAKQANPFVEKLREIDPQYAAYIESLEARAAKTETLEQRIQKFEHGQVRNEYESAVNRLHESHKVPEAIRPFVKEAVDALAIRGDLKSLDHLEAAYKQQAERFNKLIESTKRETTKSYVMDKSKDAAAPSSQPKGKPAGGKAIKAGNREELLAEIAKSAVSQNRAEREV